MKSVGGLDDTALFILSIMLIPSHPFWYQNTLEVNHTREQRQWEFAKILSLIP